METKPTPQEPKECVNVECVAQATHGRLCRRHSNLAIRCEICGARRSSVRNIGFHLLDHGFFPVDINRYLETLLEAGETPV